MKKNTSNEVRRYLQEKELLYQEYLYNREDRLEKLQADFVFAFTKIVLSISSAALGFLVYLLQDHSGFKNWNYTQNLYLAVIFLFAITIILLLLGLLFGGEAYKKQIDNDIISDNGCNKVIENHWASCAELIKKIVVVVFIIALTCLGIFVFNNL